MERLLGQYEPEEQGEHSAEAGEGLNDPRSQGRQDDKELPPGEGLCVPASQAVQDGLLGMVVYVPGGQMEHIAWPGSL